MTNANRQKVFDKTLNHLRKQGKLSRGNEICAYRGDHGTACAIGALISQSRYRRTFEGNTVDNIIHKLPKYVRDCDDYFLMALQSILHDSISILDPFLHTLENNAETFSQRWDLTYAAPQAAQ